MIVDGWLDFSERLSGPSWKQAGYASGLTQRIGKGAVVHSAVGSAQSLRNVLHGPLSKSWHMSVHKDGTVEQHYPIQAICWHAGGPNPNERYIGIEVEGGPIGNETEPLTTQQIDALVRVLRDVGAFEAWPGYVRGPAAGENLFEHNQFTGTSCPSGRIPWGEIVRRLVVTREPPFTYTREQKLTALTSFAFRASALDPAEGLDKLHPFDKAIIKEEAAKL